jgi:Skp family chaperone for outer membrane proteins
MRFVAAVPRSEPRVRAPANENEEYRTVKRAFGILAGLATLGIVAYVGSRGWAQGQQANPTYTQPAAAAATTAAPQAAPLRTRIAVVNLLQVIKNYQKCKVCEDSIRQEFSLLDKQFEEKKKLFQTYKVQYDNPQTPANTHDELERKMKALQREMQDMDEEAKQRLNKQRGDLAVTLYREIEDAVQCYAKAYDIELVLHYNDAAVPNEMYNPLNVQRKIQSGGCTPMYVAPGMDITMAIVGNLNARYSSAQQQAPAAPRGN